MLRSLGRRALALRSSLSAPSSSSFTRSSSLLSLSSTPTVFSRLFATKREKEVLGLEDLKKAYPLIGSKEDDADLINEARASIGLPPLTPLHSSPKDDALDELPDEGTPAKFEDDLSDDEFNPLLFDEKDVDKMLQIAPELKEALWWPPPQPGHGYSPRPRLRKLDELGRAYGSGGRKSSAAFCWIKPGTGKFVVNRLPYTEYFSEWRMRELMTQPLTLTGTIMQFDVFAYTLGGGKVGQAGAARHAIANALQNYDPEFRPVLKKALLLMRDPRVVERKHTGRHKARRSFQWVKR